jgi:hypothetical protein
VLSLSFIISFHYENLRSVFGFVNFNARGKAWDSKLFLKTAIMFNFKPMMQLRKRLGTDFIDPGLFKRKKKLSLLLELQS